MGIKIGVIGAGRIGERHIAAYQQIGDVDLVITDVVAQAAHLRATEWGIGRVESPTELFEDPDIVAVDICAPTAFHAAYAIEALDAGKHVFSEKPLCLTADEAREIGRAAERAGKIVMVGYLYRVHPAFEFVKTVLDQHVIGSPYLAVFRLGGRGATAAWKHQRGEGGGVFGEMMAHMIDLATWYFGEIETAEVLWKDTLLREREISGKVVKVGAEDFSVVRLRARGVEILCESDLVTPSYMQHIDIQGTNGSVFSSILHYLPTLLYCKDQHGIYDQGNNTYTFPQENLFVRELGYFIDVITGKSDSTPRIAEYIRMSEVLETLQQAPVGRLVPAGGGKSAWRSPSRQVRKAPVRPEEPE